MDLSKLRAALQALFEMDGWRKLGARIRMNVSGLESKARALRTIH
jgi:hypothetical protein